MDIYAVSGLALFTVAGLGIWAVVLVRRLCVVLPTDWDFLRGGIPGGTYRPAIYGAGINEDTQGGIQVGFPLGHALQDFRVLILPNSVLIFDERGAIVCRWREHANGRITYAPRASSKKFENLLSKLKRGVC